MVGNNKSVKGGGALLTGHATFLLTAEGGTDRFSVMIKTTIRKLLMIKHFIQTNCCLCITMDTQVRTSKN